MFGIKIADKKLIMGLAVTPNLGLEAVVYDKETNEIVKYTQKYLEYNLASKEIQDMNAFRSAISDIFNDFDIQKENTNLYLVLPNVHFGFRSYDNTDIDDYAIESMILSDAGESYIFRQEEPLSAWVDMNAKLHANTKYIAHSSFQKKVVEDIEDAIMDLGGTIVGIESSASAIPRGIALSGICNDLIEKEENWDVLLVNPNGYSIFQMQGSRLLDYIEVPFAIMSFDGDEIYSALSSAIAQYLPNYPAKKLVIESLTDNVSARMLKNEIVFDEEIVAIDSNKYGASPIMNLSDDVVKQTASSMSLSVLGACVPKFGDFATLNVMGDFNYDGVISYGFFNIADKEIEITNENIFKVSVISSIILLGLIVVFCGLLFLIGSALGARAHSLDNKISTLKTEVASLETKVKDNIVILIKQISDKNKSAINYYDSLSSDIPSQVWLNYYVNKEGDGVIIQGYSVDINDIYEYYRSLKILAPKSDIKLNKLEVFNGTTSSNNSDLDSVVLDNNNKQQTFSFEISNMTFEKTFDESGNPVQKDENDTNADNDSAQAIPASEEKKVENKGTMENQASAAKIPDIPDVEINLKEIK